MTMTPLEGTIDGGGALALPTVIGGSAPGLAILGEWVTAASHAHALVEPLVSTPFMPAALWPLPPGRTVKDFPGRNPRVPDRQEDPADYAWRRSVAVASGVSAVLQGMSLGLDPLTALANVYVVNGRPGLYVKIKLALAQSRGHRAWDEEYGADAVTCAGIRRGGSDSDVVRIRLTMKDAERAGWTTNETYAKTPADMLWSRAMGRVLDRIAGDVLFGLPSVEELDDTPDDAPAAEPARVTVQEIRERVAPAAAPAPAAAERVAEELEAVAAPPLDERAWRAINDAFVKLGVTGPGQKTKRRNAIVRIIGREITTATELTAAEGALVLDTLGGVPRDRVAALVADLDSTPDPNAAPTRPLGETAGEPKAAPVEDVDFGDADPDGDDVPEPDDDERAAAIAAGEVAGDDEPAGWTR